ncbi:hypothetical protein IWX90DRAFT_412361 [Phyllosticta citrichinensis]|uniref:Uncharacterized protein n=1 Tax=Phyllosticta citrichinensis TaxID=1130410 RepID=A0ABR1Y3U2_9PEZI
MAKNSKTYDCVATLLDSSHGVWSHQIASEAPDIAVGVEFSRSWFAKVPLVLISDSAMCLSPHQVIVFPNNRLADNCETLLIRRQFAAPFSLFLSVLRRIGIEIRVAHLSIDTTWIIWNHHKWSKRNRIEFLFRYLYYLDNGQSSIAFHANRRQSPRSSDAFHLELPETIPPHRLTKTAEHLRWSKQLPIVRDSHLAVYDQPHHRLTWKHGCVSLGKDGELCRELRKPSPFHSLGPHFQFYRPRILILESMFTRLEFDCECLLELSAGPQSISSAMTTRRLRTTTEKAEVHGWSLSRQSDCLEDI